MKASCTTSPGSSLPIATCFIANHINYVQLISFLFVSQALVSHNQSRDIVAAVYG